MEDSAPSPESADHRPLRYVPIDAIPDDVLTLEAHEIRGAGGQELGDIDGFLVDTVSGQPRYVVVHAGGRVPVRRFILPVEHTRLDVGRRSLRADLDPELIGALSVIPDHKIEALQGDELQRYHDDVRHACCPDDEDLRQFELERHALALPAWWNASRWQSHASSQHVESQPEDRFLARRQRDQRSEAADQERSPHLSADDAICGDSTRPDDDQ